MRLARLTSQARAPQGITPRGVSGCPISKLSACPAGGHLDEVEDAGEVRQELGVRVGAGAADDSNLVMSRHLVPAEQIRRPRRFIRLAANRPLASDSAQPMTKVL